MLRFLRIKHLAVIDAVEVEFDRGFNVLTGETGAGKSILVEAVGLLLGGRASGDLVRTGEDLAAIEAMFEVDHEEIIVRREITAQGRSRAFVNGNLTTAAALEDLSARLVELHGQHEHHTLLDDSTHLAFLDDYGGLAALIAPVRAAHGAMRTAAAALSDARRSATDREARLELARFQLAELDRAAVKPGEDDELAATRHVLANAERVQRLCAEGYASLHERDDAILPALGGVWRRVAELATLDAQFAAHVESREGIKSQLEDLATLLRSYGDTIDASPARLQQVEERLALLERLKRKFGPTLGEVIARRDALRAELDSIEHADSRVLQLESDAANTRTAYVADAGILSKARRRVATEFSSKVKALVADLALERTRFEVRFAEPLAEAEWGEQGIDRAEFYVSTNPGEDVRPLARIVSGGELSRIMLALKTLGATSRRGFTESDERAPSESAPGLIFDEVDAGIGGRVADVVGRKLRTLGSAFQVLCITHLPQIAAYADTHFQIDKTVSGGRTRTSIRRLDRAARVEELSRMLGGASITDAVRASAREMLSSRANTAAVRGESEPKSKGESETPKTPTMQGTRKARKTTSGGGSSHGA